MYEKLDIDGISLKATLDLLITTRVTHAYQKIIQKPQDDRTIPQYLKDWEWVDRVEGCNPETLAKLISLPDLTEFGGSLRVANAS